MKKPLNYYREILNDNIYYVSDAGNDTTGKKFDAKDDRIFPFKTIQAAIDKSIEDEVAD